MRSLIGPTQSVVDHQRVKRNASGAIAVSRSFSPIGKYCCMMILIDMRRAKSRSIRPEVCIFDFQASLALGIGYRRLLSQSYSPTEDLQSQFTFPTSYYSCSNAYIRYRYWFLPRHCHRPLSCGSVDNNKLPLISCTNPKCVRSFKSFPGTVGMRIITLRYRYMVEFIDARI